MWDLKLIIISIIGFSNKHYNHPNENIQVKTKRKFNRYPSN